MAAFQLGTALPVAAGGVIENPGDPSYVVRLQAKDDGRVWTGRVEISFTNLGPSPLSQIYVRLWGNGVDGCSRRGIEIKKISGGTMGPPTLDCTEVPITLDQLLQEGERGNISMRVRIALPRRVDRFGISRGLALAGGALPTLEVHDDEGWHHDAFEEVGDSFYSVAGEYRVTLVGPADLDMATTGAEVVQRRLADGLVSRTFAATGARDFAWAAGRLEQISATAGDTRVVVSYRSNAVGSRRANKMLDAAIDSLTTFSAAFGAYPGEELDVVLGPFYEFGGMEYPGVVFSEPNKRTVSHEVAHQWWYGLVGSDQYASPWLDEALASWSQELPFGPWVGCRSYDFPGAARMTNDMGYWGNHPRQYDTIYDGGGCMMANLANRFGLASFTAVLASYAEGHWLDVARPLDFISAIEEAAAQQLPGFDMDAFWAAWRVDVP